MKFFNRSYKIFSGITKSCFVLFCFLFLNHFASSQETRKSFFESAENSFSEELYVTSDRDLYIAGENVWLKILKLNGINHFPINISKVVYTDLLDIDNNPVLQVKTGIDANSGSAGFMLPDTLRSGNYIIRSYTNWMKNFSPDLFSYKRISVINPFDNISRIKIRETKLVPDSIIFYPEGGHLINGLETLLGLRSLSKSGVPVKAKGFVVLENNDTVCSVETDINGYGLARITASTGKKLMFIYQDNEGHSKKFFLPESEEGITISVITKKESPHIIAKISQSENFTLTDRKLYLITDVGNLENRKELKVEKDHEVILLKEDLPTGLFSVMISDDKGKILAQRWIYNEPEQSIKYSISVPAKLSAREKAGITISATDKNGFAVESDISISVVKAFTVNKKGLTSKIRQLPELTAALSDFVHPDINDNLIFYSSGILNRIPNQGNRRQVFIPELEGHLISGNIRDRKSGIPLNNKDIVLSFVGKVALCQFTKTDDEGNFNFVTMERGLREIVIEPLSPDIKDCYVELSNPFLTAIKRYDHGVFFIDTTILREINNAAISMQIKKIYEPFMQPGLKRLPVEEKPDFYGASDSEIRLSAYIELTSLKEVIKEIMPGVSTVRKNDQLNFRLINQYQSQSFENNPLVIVDGVPVDDIRKVLNINSREIERIEVLPTRYFISDIVLDGILHFISKKGNLGLIDLERSVYRLQYELPQNFDSFISPDYSVDSIKYGRIPDFRNTLYWNPDLHTDKTGKASVEFYTSDEAAEYLIIIEGITMDGRTGFASSTLKVSR